MNAGKMARSQASISNRPNCGGNKKGGMVPTVGRFMPSNPSGIRATNTMFGLMCIPSKVIQTQKYGYHAVH